MLRLLQYITKARVSDASNLEAESDATENRQSTTVNQPDTAPNDIEVPRRPDKDDNAEVVPPTVTVPEAANAVLEIPAASESSAVPESTEESAPTLLQDKTAESESSPTPEIPVVLNPPAVSCSAAVPIQPPASDTLSASPPLPSNVRLAPRSPLEVFHVLSDIPAAPRTPLALDPVPEVNSGWVPWPYSPPPHGETLAQPLRSADLMYSFLMPLSEDENWPPSVTPGHAMLEPQDPPSPEPTDDLRDLSVSEFLRQMLLLIPEDNEE